MQLIEENNVLNFIAEGNETEDQQAFLAYIKQYIIKKNGSTILIFDQQNRLMTCIKPFDNTQLVLADDGYKLASYFGGKRFLVSQARALMSDIKANEVKAIHFARDLSFPIEKKEEANIHYRVLDLPGVLNEFRTDKNKLYDTIAELFNRCANFTPGKQDEYLAGGAKEDKYCRFNVDENISEQKATTSHVFLMDQDKIIGTISASIIQGDDGAVDIYFYDEIVDYFTLLSQEEIDTLYQKTEHLKNEENENTKLTLKKEIADLIEPKRTVLMTQLFSAARKEIGKVIKNLDEKIAQDKAHAFIRAADGRVDAYVELDCGTNAGNLVIHGPAMLPLKMLDAHVKTWSAQQLKVLQPKPSSVSFLTPNTEPPTNTSNKTGLMK